MTSDTEEDFPLNGGSDKLAKIFEDNALDDISFKFSPPKQPSGKINKHLQNTVPLKVLYGKTVEAFQMKIGGYKSEGKVGLAIIGNEDYHYYQIYMYRSDERKVASAEITFQFCFLVQEHNYASFKDSLGIQWSVHFDKPSDLVNFSQEMALARWLSAPSCQCKLIQEAFKGKTENIVQKSDSIKVNCTLYKLPPGNNVLEESSAKVLTIPASSTLWGIDLVGACLKSRRLIIIPSQQCETEVNLSLPPGVHVMVDLEIEEIIPLSSSCSQSSCSIGIQNASSKRSIAKNDENITLSERISRIGYALPNLQASEIDCGYNVSDIMKNEAQKPLTPVSSASAITKEDSNYSDVCDVTITSQFNMLFSEVRTSNSEIRMNIGRVNDKIDTLICKTELNPQVTDKIIPIMDKMEKIENLNVYLCKIVDQNNAMMSLFEKNCLPNFQSTLNEVLHLKKRNSELEALLEVAGSTSHILKEKITDLNHKILLMEKIRDQEENSICAHCNGAGDKIVKVLEENVRVLEEKNLKLVKTTKELEQQNKNLNEHTMSAIQGQSNQELSFQLHLLEKDKKIEILERDIDKLNSEIKKRCSRQVVEKEITEVAKALMNKAYKTLKSVARDSAIIDHSFADALREMTKDYLENHFEQKCTYFFENEEPFKSFEEVQSEENYDQQGKIPFKLSTVPLPIPKPRKPLNLKQSSVITPNCPQNIANCKLKERTLNTNENTENETYTSDVKMIPSIINRDLEDETVTDQVISVLTQVRNLVISLHNTKQIENNNSQLTYPSVIANTVDSNDNVEREIVFKERDRLSNDSNCSKTESYCSPCQQSYSSSFYTPLIPTTPPPIFDDSSD